MKRPVLRALAERLGILEGYRDNQGVSHLTSDGTREALLAALGHDASTESEAARALDALDRTSRCIAPFACFDADARPRRLRLRAPLDSSGPIEWALEVHQEDGGLVHASGSSRARPGGPIPVSLLHALPPGYHEVRATLRTAASERADRQVCVVAPVSCTRIEERTHRRGFGLLANLYTVRSATNHGFGDLGDLERLVDWAASARADFVGTNPLHASWNRGAAVSPYQASSRLYRNPLYLDLDAVPESHGDTEAAMMLDADDSRARLAAFRHAERIDYEGLAAWAAPLHAALHRAFVERHRGHDTPREREFLDYVQQQGEPLRDFATFQALDAFFGGRERGWYEWPAPFRDVRSPDVARFREQHAIETERHCWLQFELDRQLARVASRAEPDLAIGLFGDLALGSAPGGSDHWAFPDLFVDGAALGAPPDDYAGAGQDWSLPPLHPHRLAEDGFRYWTLLLRNALRHMGALRIDHIMGLFRQFWIPAGSAPLVGAYVRAPTDALLAILALESRRARAIIIGEDLGTVPRGLPARLARHGILSSRVMYFERERGAFRRAARYSARALVTANTHDHAPLTGWFEGADLKLRRDAGAIASDDLLDEALVRREEDRQALLRRLRRDGHLSAIAAPTAIDLCSAVHGFLARTAAPLLGIALDDLALEHEPVNLPGVPQSAHASWTRRMHVSIEQLRTDANVHRVLDTVARTRTRAP